MLALRFPVSRRPVAVMAVASFDPNAGSSDAIAAVAVEVFSEVVKALVQQGKLFGGNYVLV